MRFYLSKQTNKHDLCLRVDSLERVVQQDGTDSLSIRSSLHRLECKPSDMDAGREDGRREVFGGF